MTISAKGSTGSLPDNFPPISNAVLYHDIMQRPDLSPSARQLFFYFWRCQHQPHPLPALFFSEKTLAKLLYCSVRTIRRALRQLEQAQLIRTIRRLRPNARNDKDWTTNRYVLTWRPAAAESNPSSTDTPSNPDGVESPLPTPSAAEAVEPSLPGGVSPLEAPPEIAVNPAEASTVDDSSREDFRPVAEDLPAVSVTGGLQPECPQGPPEKTSEPLGASRIERSPVEAILKDFSLKLDQQPADPILTLAGPRSESVLSVSEALKPLGIRIPLLLQWAEQFSPSRVVEVAQWVLSAPAGLIRSAGGWMHQALTQAWEAPSWTRQAEQLAAQQTRQQAADATALAERQADQQRQQALQAEQAEDRAQWELLQPLLAQYPEITTMVTARAKQELGALAARLCTPTSMLWQQYCLQAARRVGLLPDRTDRTKTG